MNENKSAMRKMTAGPQDQANWLMPMLAARLVEEDISEMWLHDDGTPAPTDRPEMTMPAQSMGRFTAHIMRKTPVAYTSRL